jgi:hypothetical protein
MKSILSTIACLLICGSVLADEKKIEIEKVKVLPKVGVAVRVVRPSPGNYYWRHPTYGWGYWYYPAPRVAVPTNYYLDEFGRVVPSGYGYDVYGNLVPLRVAPYYQGYYRRWGYWR